jgi:hypothetical protein
LEWQLEKIPTRNTIENWVKKCGYEIYRKPFLESSEKEYARVQEILLKNVLIFLAVPFDFNTFAAR